MFLHEAFISPKNTWKGAAEGRAIFFENSKLLGPSKKQKGAPSAVEVHQKLEKGPETENFPARPSASPVPNLIEVIKGRRPKNMIGNGIAHTLRPSFILSCLQ